MKMKERKRATGFTLTEIMISIVIFIIITLFGYHIFRADHKVFVEQEEVVDMQQNARVALDQVVRDLRLAGSGVPLGGVQSDLGPLSPVMPAASAGNLPDTVILLASYLNVQSELSDGMPESSSELKVEDSSRFFEGALCIITGHTRDCGDAAGEAFQITEISDDGQNMIQHNPNAPWNDDQKLNCTYVPPTRVILVNYRKYYIDYTDPNHPMLMLEEDARPPQIVADNIENLQLVYDLVTGEKDQPNPDYPGSIRKATVTLVARTNTPDVQWHHGINSITGENDRYRRLTLNSDVQVRNLKR
jgi:type IV pilus assembly protein PilW